MTAYLPIVKCWRLPNDRVWGAALYRRATGTPAWLMFAYDGGKVGIVVGPFHWLKGHGWRREKREGKRK